MNTAEDIEKYTQLGKQFLNLWTTDASAFHSGAYGPDTVTPYMHVMVFLISGFGG